MPNFRYQGRDSSGKLVNGELTAAAASIVADQLLQKGIIPLAIQEVKTQEPFGQRLQKIFERKVPVEELILFCRQMYALIRAGVPLIGALSRIAETTHSAVLATALKKVVESINEGQTLTAALQPHARVFSNVFISIIDAGENSGQLEQSFMQLSSYLDLEARTMKRLKSASRYPMIVIVTIAIAIIVINVVVVPAFGSMFAQLKAQLPLPTRILMATSDYIRANGVYILIALVAFVVGVIALLRNSAQARLYWDYSKLRIPVIGGIVKKIVLGRFARSFTMVIRTGVPIIQGINLVSNTVGNVYIGDRIKLMRIGIEKGDSLTKTAIEAKLFSPLVLQMLSVGEEAGSIDTMLEHVAEFYEREVDYDLSRLNDLIEPFILSLLGAMVLVLALAVYLPMWDMVRHIRAK